VIICIPKLKEIAEYQVACVFGIEIPDAPVTVAYCVTNSRQMVVAEGEGRVPWEGPTGPKFNAACN
jgi:hypothetical protein